MDGGLSSSFIEAFKTASTEVKALVHSSNTDACKVEAELKEQYDNIFEAAKSGSLEAVKTFPPYELLTLDSHGHTICHWTALFGHYELLEYLIKCGAPYNIASRHEMGQYPIHWACVNNHYQIVDLLLQCGVSIDLRDNAGATPLIVAAQYGAIAVCAMLLSKGADLQAIDNEGDSVLHWAAFRGNSDLCRMLVYSGLDPKQEDNFRQTPLHMACMSGNLRTVKEFVIVDAVDTFAVDANGKLALDLARGRGFGLIVLYLEEEMKNAKRVLPKCEFSTLVYGPTGTMVPIMFYILLAVFWGYPMYLIKVIPNTFESHFWSNILFLTSNLLMILSLYHCNSVDPGYLPRNTREYDHVIKQMGRFNSNDRKDSENKSTTKSQMDRLCHSCRLVKPLRTSHCSFCKRCVVNFDHHCPYVANCVGINNRHSFLVFVSSGLVVILVSLYFITIVWSLENYEFRWDYAIGTTIMSLFCFLASYVVLSVWNNAFKNITTNERLRWKNYSYLKDMNGKFKNPFNLNFAANLLYYFNLVTMIIKDDGTVEARIIKPLVVE